MDQRKSRLYLYNLGDECNDVTGGWVQQGYIRGGSYVVTKEESQMSVETAELNDKDGFNASTVTVGTYNSIDLRRYKKIVFVGSFEVHKFNSIAEIYLTDNLVTASTLAGAFGSYKEIFKFGSGSSNSGTFEADISSSDAGHIAICADKWAQFGFSKIVVREMWLEK